MNIRIRPGAWLASVNESGVFIPSISIVADAILHRDDETDDAVFEFEYNGQMWTVGSEHVDLIRDDTPRHDTSAFITKAMTDAWESAFKRATSGNRK